MYGAYIRAACLRHGLDPEVFASLIMQESSGNPLSFRYEPAFYRRYIHDKGLAGFVPNPLRIPDRLERDLRSTSFGLCQIMGQVAREQGFRNEWLPTLCDPQINIDLGAKILASFIKAKGSERAGLLRYNGGGDPNYPDKIYTRKQRGEYKFVLY